ncbi:DUF6892 domain-containing protein [Streptomyces mutabilis]|uniref:DUF6892 domain-containing protein n=1 Tax=Streptomyces mutabilis TaxID=67332 RepID=UPI0019881EB1|nr:hypothetical protein [Streptomyces mutabilis]GGQ10496.1 hypothetical protein GCM10010279_17380 [Streptomyces mutabilis]
MTTPGSAQQHGLTYQVVPEARSYFASSEISEELLAGVEELCMDGGNQVYRECAPVWDGEDDLFDVASLDDLVLLPNLRRVLGSDSWPLSCGMSSAPAA